MSVCPRCGKERLRKHCNSESCPWQACMDCGAVIDGWTWFRQVGKKFHHSHERTEDT